jgi:hypothetical protein
LKRNDSTPVHESKVTRIARYLKSRNFFEDSIESEGEKYLRGCLSLSRFALTIGHIVSLAPAFEHLRNELRWILKIGIEDHDNLAFGLIQATGDGELVTEVSRQSNCLYESALLGVLTDEWPGVVFATVIDEHNLERARVSGDKGCQASPKLRQNLLFVVARDDYRDTLGSSVTRNSHEALIGGVRHVFPLEA